ncbi:MAG: low molecular weight protein-tyrosine-phosphatase [Bacteroidales bacterium]|jgi:protein-tyrosine phosphatase|nr:low molecular weight phosphotyrosine protein phosphatase [Bacteroidales bacterium]MDD3702262.1 low molecular weight phosphotyrosine protein phosphatase [Bacteroidales bacterium]MDY0368863.1 low molecular weight protein-tyrosine-phosphatase [Bacteroidales bacterium]
MAHPPIRILFVCLGNICRSPAAEAVFQKIASDHNFPVHLDSAGISNWHAGEQADPRMRKAAKKRDYEIHSIARPFQPADFDRFDQIIVMDDANYDHLKALATTDEEIDKIYRMSDFLSEHSDDHIPDPYYGGEQGFDFVIDLLEDASKGLLQSLLT